MKKFMLKFAAFALALVLPFVGYFAYQQSKPAVFTGSLMGCLQYKVRMLRDTPGERVVLVGGSGLPYSVACDEVSEAFGRPCLNMGGTAYVGPAFYLSMVKPYIHEGDIIVLAPEFSMYMNFFSYSTVWMTVENDDLLLAAIPKSYYMGMMRNYHNYVQDRNTVLDTHGMPQGTLEERYASFGFGPYGDLTFQRAQGWSEGASRGDSISVGAETPEPEVLQSMNEFYAYATRRGAAVYLTYSPFCEEAVPTGLDGVAAFEATVRENCDIPLISNLQDGILPRSLFFNSNNHLTSEGMRLRTAALIEDLQNAGVGG